MVDTLTGCLRDMLDTLMDVDNEDWVESIKYLMKIFYCHVVHHFGLVFGGKSI